MTLLAKVTLNESAELDFGLEISGTDSKDMDIRFIIEGPHYNISCKCIESGGTITASIPKLAGILTPGTYKANLEVVVDGKHFRPLTERIEFIMPMTVGVLPRVSVKEPSISVRASNISISHPTPPAQHIPEETEAPSKKKERLEEMAAKIRDYEELLAKARRR